MTTVYNKLALVGLVTISTLIVGFTGCDSTPAPPTDVPPSVSADAPTKGPAGGKGAVRSIKNRPAPAESPANP